MLKQHYVSTLYNRRHCSFDLQVVEAASMNCLESCKSALDHTILLRSNAIGQLEMQGLAKLLPLCYYGNCICLIPS